MRTLYLVKFDTVNPLTAIWKVGIIRLVNACTEDDAVDILKKNFTSDYCQVHNIEISEVWE